MTTLAQLKLDVGQHLDRTDLGSKIALFSRLVQSRLERVVQPSFLENKATIPVVNNAFTFPLDSIKIIQTTLITGLTQVILNRKSEGFVRQNNLATKYYWRNQGIGYLGGNPAAGASVELDYRGAQANLINDADSNAWTLNAYDIMFWGVAMYGAIYLKDDEETAVAKMAFDVLLLEIQDHETAYDQSDNLAFPGD